MKSILHSVLMATGLELALLFITTNLVLAQVVSTNSTAPRFYCGQVKDPNSNTNIPATLLSNSTNKEPITIVAWKEEYSSWKYSSQARCEIVLPKLQTAFDTNRTYLMYGVDKLTGLGLICAILEEEKTCDYTNIIFTVKAYSNAREIVENLINIVDRRSRPIGLNYDSFNLQDLIKYGDLP